MADSAANIDRVLIVRLSAMGDIIHALPAAFALRAGFPHAMIGWLIEERWAELLCATGSARRGPRSAERPLADWVHTVKLTGWRKSLFSLSTIQQIATVWNDVRSAGYDVAIDLQGAIRSAVLARLSGAPVAVGSAEPRESPAGLWYTGSVIARGAHVVDQGLSIVESLTHRKVPSPRVDFPRDRAVEDRIRTMLKTYGVGDDMSEEKRGNFAILNPGAGWGAKRWPAARYGEVAARLAGVGFRSIINYGPGEEALARDCEYASGGAAHAVQTSISELIALTRRARLFIGGDTGPMHLAAAMEVPVVAIFGPTDPARNGPYATRSVVLRNPASVTTHARRADPDDAMLDITVDAVVAAARNLLDTCPASGKLYG